MLAVVGLVGARLWGLRALLSRRHVPACARASRAPVALRGLLAGAFFGVEAIVPLSLSLQHGYGATAAGLPLAVAGFCWAFGSWWQGRPTTRRRAAAPRIALIRMGFALIAASARA